jgi:hypothetical protein
MLKRRAQRQCGLWCGQYEKNLTYLEKNSDESLTDWMTVEVRHQLQNQWRIPKKK